MSVEAPRARRPGLSLEVLVKELDAMPRTAEMELALADFMMLPQQEQLRIVFLAMLQNSGVTDWCVETIKKLISYQEQPD